MLPGLLTNHFNDLLLIPAALPIILWFHRRLGLRSDDAPPRPDEIVLHLAVWSVLCEGIGPSFMPGTVGDWRDVVAYAIGALSAFLCWQHPRFAGQRPSLT